MRDGMEDHFRFWIHIKKLIFGVCLKTLMEEKLMGEIPDVIRT
jgi:hypothetical protein